MLDLPEVPRHILYSKNSKIPPVNYEKTDDRVFIYQKDDPEPIMEVIGGMKMSEAAIEKKVVGYFMFRKAIRDVVIRAGGCRPEEVANRFHVMCLPLFSRHSFTYEHLGIRHHTENPSKISTRIIENSIASSSIEQKRSVARTVRAGIPNSVVVSRSYIGSINNRCHTVPNRMRKISLFATGNSCHVSCHRISLSKIYVLRIKCRYFRISVNGISISFIRIGCSHTTRNTNTQ